MHRSLILGLLFSLLSFAAHAVCPSSTSPSCGDPMQTTTSGSVMYAAAYGVKADGVTSDDVALKAATDACAAVNAMLILPPGQSLLTGAAQSTLRNCHIYGSGTTFNITGNSISPFIIGSGWGISGVRFYWPNQITGGSFYPPLFQDAGAVSTAGHWLDHVSILNAYDGFAETSGSSWGNIYITNSDMYAVHDLFRMSHVGDMIHMSNMHFTSGAWQATAPVDLTSALNTAQTRNTIFHVTAGPIVQVEITNVATFSWRYGFLVDSGGVFAASDIRAFSIDNVGTIVDSSSGGNFSGQMSGGGGCAVTSYPSGHKAGNAPCFNLGAAGEITLRDFNFAGQGSGIVTQGANVTMQVSECDGVGAINDGANYSCIDVQGVDSGTTVLVQDATMTGSPANTHVFGITSGANAIPNFILQNSSFLYFQTPVKVTFANEGVVTGNRSAVTNGTLAFDVPRSSVLT